MKEIAQTLLILGGGLGLLGSIPLAIYGWLIHRAFSSDLTDRDYLTFYAPLICLATLVVGLAWRKAEMKKRPRKGHHLTEDGGFSGDFGGSD